MNEYQRKELAKKIQECAFLYGKMDLNAQQVTMYLNVLDSCFEQFSYEDFMRAFNSYMRSPKNKYFPAPAHLREYLEPQINSIEIARTIDKCIQKYGSTWSWGYFDGFEDGNKDKPIIKFRGKNNQFFKTFDEALKSEIGEIGANCVNEYGGWKSICNSYYESQESHFIAQLRSLIDSKISNPNYQSLKNIQIETLRSNIALE